jgi:hypothetical protein
MPLMLLHIDVFAVKLRTFINRLHHTLRGGPCEGEDGAACAAPLLTDNITNQFHVLYESPAMDLGKAPLKT